MLCVPVVVTEAWCWVNGNYAGHRPYHALYRKTPRPHPAWKGI